MTTPNDIVSRLREHARQPMQPDLIIEAADEIERLQKRLAEESHAANRLARRNAALVCEINLLSEARLRKSMYEGQG